MSVCMCARYGLFEGLFKFVGCVFLHCKGCAWPDRVGVGCCSKAGIFDVVRDVSFGAKWEVDRVVVDDSLYVEALV